MSPQRTSGKVGAACGAALSGAPARALHVHWGCSLCFTLMPADGHLPVLVATMVHGAAADQELGCVFLLREKHANQQHFSRCPQEHW